MPQKATMSIVGNSPSSGSELLAQLLDSTQYSACGVELKLFANKAIYNFDKFKKNIRLTSKDSGIHTFRNQINFHRIHSYGLNFKELENMVQSSKDIFEFREKFAFRFLALRGKETSGIVFEKTPSNINCINEFTSTFEDGYFIHIVRNPLYVYTSLLKRPFPNYISSLSWLMNVAKYIKYKNNDRVILVKYEDLVETPFAIIKNILQEITGIIDISDNDIKSNFETNLYRKLFSPTLKSWKTKSHGKVINSNTTEFTNSELDNLAKMLNTKITSRYAKHFDMAEISFVEAIKEFGYHDEVMEKLKPHINKKCPPSKDFEDLLRIGLKWEEDLRHGDAGLFQLGSYLNPIELI